MAIAEGTPYAGMTRIRLRVGAALRTLSAHMTRTPLVSYSIEMDYNSLRIRIL